MLSKKYLIVNADDFGHSPAVNRGIIRAHNQGILTSASLMVRWPAAVDAVELAKSHPELSLGLHLDFGEWAYQNESWIPVYTVVPVDDMTAVRNEVSNQVASFLKLTGRNPTHIDSHQHAHLREPARSAVLEVGLNLNIPVRDCSPEVRYCGRFYGQTAEGSTYPEGITSDSLIKIFSQLMPGVTELGCHPGEGTIPNSTYSGERATEVEALCAPKVLSALDEMEIELCGFGELPALLTSAAVGSATR